MDEYARGIFELAILREELASRTYSRLAGEAKNDAIKQIFIRLAEEELTHRALISKMDLGTLMIANREDLVGINLLEGIDKKRLFSEDVSDISATLDFAIKEEEKDIDQYKLLGNHTADGEGKTLLLELARQESRHRMLLQMVKLKFHDNDWKKL